MKKKIWAVLIVALATLGFGAAFFYTSGFEPYLRQMLRDAFLYPANFRSARPTGPFSFQLKDVVVDLSVARAEATDADIRLSAGIFPLRLTCDCAMNGIRLRPKNSWVNMNIFFGSGSFRLTRRMGSTQIRFPEWKSDAIQFAGEAMLDNAKSLKALRVSGSVNPAFLATLLPDKGPPDSADAPVPFDARLGDGIFEIKIRGKTWFRSTWVMRPSNPLYAKIAHQ